MTIDKVTTWEEVTGYRYFIFLIEQVILNKLSFATLFPTAFQREENTLILKKNIEYDSHLNSI